MEDSTRQARAERHRANAQLCPAQDATVAGGAEISYRLPKTSGSCLGLCWGKPLSPT